MKITIEIPNDEIRQEVPRGMDGTIYRRILKESVNAVLKEHADEIAFVQTLKEDAFLKTLQEEADNNEQHKC